MLLLFQLHVTDLNVRLFIKPWCGWCQQAVDWLDARGVAYEKIDVTADEAAFEEMIRLSGQDLAPVIDVDGKSSPILARTNWLMFWKKLPRVKEIDDPPKPNRVPASRNGSASGCPRTDTFAHTRSLLDELKLHTVCESAQCPNHWECWSKGTATFMIGGDRCTRACGFCAVSTAKPFAFEPDEPARVAEAAHRMRLRHVVITAVARDDLADGGADHFRRTIELVRAAQPGIVIEVLTPDFHARNESIDAVLSARPDIFNHNLETVRRLDSRRSLPRHLRSLAQCARQGQSPWRRKPVHQIRPDAWPRRKGR